MLNERLSEGGAVATSTIIGNESPGFYYGLYATISVGEAI